jgi:hypothetical protein
MFWQRLRRGYQLESVADQSDGKGLLLITDRVGARTLSVMRTRTYNLFQFWVKWSYFEALTGGFWRGASRSQNQMSSSCYFRNRNQCRSRLSDAGQFARLKLLGFVGPSVKTGFEIWFREN